jgi:hypothetical protein
MKIVSPIRVFYFKPDRLFKLDKLNGIGEKIDKYRDNQKMIEKKVCSTHGSN